MELRYFFSVLSKRKWLLLSAMLFAAATTWVVVNMLPKKYKSSATIRTSITDFKSVRVGELNPFVQEFEIENKFANLIEYMKSRPAVNALTQQLMIHDLTVDSVEKPFRKLDLEKTPVSKEQIDNYLAMLTKNTDTIGLSDIDLQNLSNARALEKVYGYDYETITKKIDIKREGKSDFVQIAYISEDPKLTYFVVKNYADAVLRYYYSRKDTTEKKSVVFYNDFLKAKKDSLEKLNNRIYDYSKANGVVALLEQSQSIVAQIKEAEMELTEERKKFAGYNKTALLFEKSQQHYADFIQDDYKKNVFNNEEVKNLTNEINNLYGKYGEKAEKDEALKKKIEDLKGRRINVSNRIALGKRDDQDPVVQKNQDLYLRYIDAKSNKEAAEQKITVLESSIQKLKGEKAKLVNNNATLKKLTTQAEVAEDEYKSAVEKQSQANAIKQSSNEEDAMHIIEQPLPPTKPENTKAPLLSAFAGVGTGTLATIFLFLLTYMDRSLSTPFQYSKLIGLPLLGVLNNLNSRKIITLDYLFEDKQPVKANDYFKESLRKIRHDIEVSGYKSFLFVSLKEQDGKSFLAGALAYTFSLKNKKVLIIDTNFKNNTLTGLSMSAATPSVTGESEQAELMPQSTRLSIDVNLPSVTVIGNNGGHNSPSELLSGIDFKKKIKDLSKNYDYIFLEAACLNKYSDALELVDYVEKVIPVFDATTSVSKIDENGIAFLKSLDDKVLGGVLNKAELKTLI